MYIVSSRVARRILLAPAVLGSLAVAALLLTRPGSLESQTIDVGENVRVSAAHPDRAHYETVIAAHPDDPGVLLGAAMAWSDSANDYDVVAYRSADGGRTWSPTLEVDRAGTVMDPTVAFGPDGWAYLGEFGGGEDLLHRSADGGASWREPLDIDFGDRPFLAVSGPDARNEGRLYLHSTGRTDPIDERAESLTGIQVARVDEHGSELLSRSTLHLSGDRTELGTGESALLSDGTLVFLYPERDRTDIGRYEGATGPDPREEREPNARLMAVVSRDGGRSFEPARAVADWYHRFGRGRTATIPALAADTSRGPFRDRLYAAWTDFRSGRAQVLLARSEDGGETWSDPIVVNREGGPAFRPMLAVNDAGVLGVAWYDRRDSPTGLGWSVRFAASMDGGVTVGPSVPVSEGAFRYTWDRGLVVIGRGGGGASLRASAVLHAFNDIGGHTAGMAADASGRFHPFWVDNRTGVPQLWTAAVDVEGRAVRHGDPSLADLRDVTSRTALQVERAGYGGSPDTVTLRVRLRNTSDDTIQAPLVLRVVDLWSEYGDVTLATEGAGGGETGSVIPLTPHLEDARLLPDSSSSPVQIRATIESPKALGPMPPPPPGRRGGGGYGLLSVEARALGRVRAPVSGSGQAIPLPDTRGPYEALAGSR